MKLYHRNVCIGRNIVYVGFSAIGGFRHLLGALERTPVDKECLLYCGCNGDGRLEMMGYSKNGKTSKKTVMIPAPLLSVLITFSRFNSLMIWSKEVKQCYRLIQSPVLITNSLKNNVSR